MSKLIEQINIKAKIGSIKDLVFPVSNTYNFSGKDEVVFINTGDVYEGKFLHKNYLSTKKLPGQAKKIIEPGDILFSEIRPKNRHFALVNFDSKDYVVSTKLIVLKVKENINPRYAYIVLTANQNLREFQNIAESRSGTFPQITFESIADYEVNIPDLITQNKISKILSAYDEKIINNNEIIKKLELTAQTIFKEWFIDLRFPGYENIQLLNTDDGKIPEGWSVKSLDEVSDIVFGFNFKANKFNEEKIGVPVVRIRDVLDGKTNTFSSEIPGDEYKINTGDLLIGMDGTFHCSFWYTNGAYLNQRVARIRSELPGYFIFESVRLQLDFLQRTITGATVGHLANGDVRNFQILIPQNVSILEPFDNITKKILTLKKEIISLESQRDQLLSELI